MPDLFDNLTSLPDKHNRIYGVVIGIVTNNQDPDSLNRVKVKFPWLSPDDESAWARVATPMAGRDRGLYLLPEVDDEVLVAFEHGDINYPFVIGTLWNGKDTSPENNSDGKNNMHTLKSRSGHIIRLDDTDGSEKIQIIDKHGKNSIVFDTANDAVTITADKDITIKASSGTLTLQANKIEIKSDADLKVEAGGNMDLKASGQANLKGSVVNIN